MSKITITKGTRTKKVKQGFSWTVFFFGFMALGIRGQWGPAAITFLTFGLAGFYYMFKANEILLDKYLDEGWEVKA